MMDEVQCGYFRSGRFQSFQRILEGVPGAHSFLPDAISMAKSIAGGFPMGAFWVRQPYANLLGPGTHASTFGGTPLACAVALKVLEVIEKENLADNARQLGIWFQNELTGLSRKYPAAIKAVRGLGFMIGFELSEYLPIVASSGGKAISALAVNRLHAAGLLAIPAGTPCGSIIAAPEFKPKRSLGRNSPD